VRAALGIAAALLAAAAPAVAASAPIGRSALTAGPVLADGSVLWADAPSGRPRVLAGGPGRDPVVRAHWPRATAGDTGRTVAALAASSTRVAAIVAVAETPSCQGIARSAAGRYLAVAEAGRAVLYDLRRRAVERRLALTGIESLDVQHDRTLALLDHAPRGKTFGGLNLGPGRAVWAVGDPSGYQRIVLRRL
jgi:hypothetical protein